MAFKQTITTRILELPAFTVDQKTMENIGKLASSGIVDNIQKQIQEDGSPIKRNSPGTITRKISQGKQPKSLIDQLLRFVKPGIGSWKWTLSGSGTSKWTITLEPATEWLKETSIKLQLWGYVGWFGFSLKVKNAMVYAVRSCIARSTKSGVKK